MHGMKRIKSIGFYQDQTEKQANWAATRGANLKGHHDVTGIIRNMVLANLGFHTQMNFKTIHNLGMRSQEFSPTLY